jgi:F0F1-type ATP synthase membrane subunit b/b'
MKGIGFFDGSAGAKRKVDLRGKSADAGASKSKEQLLAEARREREARAAHKAATQGATRIQARSCVRLPLPAGAGADARCFLARTRTGCVAWRARACCGA